MVICNECGTRVPPKVASCPKCEAPVDATNGGPPGRARRKLPAPTVVTALAALVALAVAGVALYLLLR